VQKSFYFPMVTKVALDKTEVSIAAAVASPINAPAQNK
jgi:hypothetical protein